MAFFAVEQFLEVVFMVRESYQVNCRLIVLLGMHFDFIDHLSGVYVDKEVVVDFYRFINQTCEKFRKV